jgi:hypothetical protein
MMTAPGVDRHVQIRHVKSRESRSEPTDHARRKGVEWYASVQLEVKRRLLEGKQGRNL